VAVAAIAFSGKAVIIKLAYRYGVDAVTLLALRMVFSAPFFALLGWWAARGKDIQPLSMRDRGMIVGLGLVGYYLASYFDFLGLQYIPAGLGRLIMFLYPTLVVLLSAIFLGKRPTRRGVAALAITYAGIALVLSQQLGVAPEHRMFLFGALLVFSSSMCYAVYLVAGSQLVKRVGSLRFTAYTMIISTLPAVVQFALLESPAALDLPAQVWGYVAVLAFGCTVFPVLLVAESLKRIGANHFALIGALGPVTTVLADFGLLGGALGAAQIAGGALVILGVLLVSLKRS